MLSRFSSLRYLAAGGASKIVATTRATPASNLLLHKEYVTQSNRPAKGDKAKRPREDGTLGQSCPPSKRAKFDAEGEGNEGFKKNRKVAVLLSGCGKMDGTDVVEAIALAVNLDRYRYISVDYYALDKELEHSWDHQNWTSMNRVGNVRNEAARLLRTAHVYELNELEKLKAIYDGLIIPGGRGVGWNLMTLAARRDPTQLNQSLRTTIMNLVKRKKPIGCSSEGGILPALILQGVNITFGREAGRPEDNQTAWRTQLIAEARSLNALHEDKGSIEHAHCPRYNVYSVPGHLGTMPDFATCHYSIGRLVWTFRNHWDAYPED